MFSRIGTYVNEYLLYDFFHLVLRSEYNFLDI